MSERAHFWIRVAALAVILVAEFGPRWSASSKPPAARATMTAVAAAR
jgi:hypothetical protein